MHWFDVSTGIALLIGGVWSFFRGLVREVSSILGITAAFVLSFRGYRYVAQHLQTVIAYPWLQHAAGFGLIFLATVVLYVVIAALLHRLITAAGLSVPNRLLGGLFGLAKITVMVAVLCLITAQFFPLFAARLATESLLAPLFFRAADALSMLLPPDATEEFHSISERLRQQLPAWAPVPPASSSSQSPALTPPAASPPDDISPDDARALEKLLRQRLETR
jgi:membrane protein required for colicin V production